MKNFKMFLYFAVCGLRQAVEGYYLRGIVMFAVFWSSAALLGLTAWQRLLFSNAVIPSLLSLIAVSIWVYNLLDVLDIQKASASDDPAKEDVDLYEKGKVLYFRGDLDKAKECFEKLYRGNKKDMDSVFQLAKINKELGDKQSAQRLFRSYVKNGDKLEWLEEAREQMAGKK
ncbi:tol-pal system YbgF family protein [Candidatus Auribacterota bacterium]